MQIEQELAGLKPEKDTLLTIGVFDGVHPGHKYLISRLTDLAQERDLLSGVVTFRQHPQAVLAPRTKPAFLADLGQRIRLLKKEGVDEVFVLSFTPELVQLDARHFLGLLKKHLRMQGLVIGYDFALGRKREGDTDTLLKLGQEMNFAVTVVPPLTINGGVVSSTVIREALASGDVRRVCNLTGHYYSLQGRVVTGSGRGRELGFPTANLEVSSEQTLPADGVYVAWAHIDGKTYPAMTNIGRNPTFGNNQRTVEVYVLDCNKDLYQQKMRIDIVERLRDEKKFDTVAELKEQIARDIEQGRAILNGS